MKLIQGSADKTLEWQKNTAVFKDKLGNLDVSLIDLANHHMVNEVESLRWDIFSAIDI